MLSATPPRCGFPERTEEAHLGASDDDGQPEKLLARARIATDADRARLRRRTAQLVEEHWAEIERVAQEPLLSERLDEVELTRILLAAVRGEITEEHLAMLPATYQPLPE
jgi:hypothetical protein